MISLKGLVVFSALFVATVYGDCFNVKDSDIAPCVCITNQIRCEGEKVTDQVLADVLAKIDKSRPSYLKEFEGLELYNTKVTKVTTEIFGKLILKTYVKFNNNPITSISLGNFPDLVLFDAANNKLSNITSALFFGLKSIRYVNLGGNGIVDFPKDTFSLSDNLERLDLSGNQIKRLNSDEFSSEYHNNIELSEIDLSNNELEYLPENIFWPLRRPLKINLANNKLSKGIELNALSFGEDLIQFEPIKIVLSNNGFKDADLTDQTFEPIVRQKLAIDLDLSDNALTAASDKVLDTLRKANPRTVITKDTK